MELSKLNRWVEFNPIKKIKGNQLHSGKPCWKKTAYAGEVCFNAGLCSFFLLVCAGPLLVYDGHALAKNEHK